MTTIDTTSNTPLPDVVATWAEANDASRKIVGSQPNFETLNPQTKADILAWGGTETAQDTHAARQRSDFALRQGEFDPRLDAQKIAQAFGIPLSMLGENPGKLADAVIKARGAQWDAMQVRIKARAAKCARMMERGLFGAPPVTKAPRGKHGKRPSRNALRAHRASQLRAQSCAASRARLVSLCSHFTRLQLERPSFMEQLMAAGKAKS